MNNDISFSDVALLLPCLLTGGTEVATLETALSLASLGHHPEVIVYFNEIDPAMLATFASAGIRVIVLGACREGLKQKFVLAWKLFIILWRRGYALVWVQYMTPTLMPLLIARILSHKLVTAVHVAASHFQGGAINRLRWLAKHLCDQVICVSNTTATGIFSDGKYWNKITVIPNAVNVTGAQQAESWDWRKKLGWPSDCVVVGFSGRLAAIKGIDVLLQALDQLQEKFPQIRTVIVGDGVERANSETFVAAHRMCERVHFAGQLERGAVMAAIKGFDIAAVPSREEGFGLSALEAMAVGVPVVASRVHALEEVVVDGKTGLLFILEDPSSLADSMVRLADDIVLRRELGAAGACHAAMHYDVPIHRARIAKLLAHLGLHAPGAA